MKKLFAMMMVVIMTAILTGCGVRSTTKISTWRTDEDGNTIKHTHVIERDNDDNITAEYYIDRNVDLYPER